MENDKNQIPKIIHYCWFGKQAMPKMLQHCLASWQKILPNYQIILWNEDNSDFDCEFVREAYRQKKWAFVSDYIRLKVIHDFGGIYLDTDMLLLQSLESFLSHDCFFCAFDNQTIGMGIFGAKKEDAFIFTILEHYKTLKGSVVDFRPNTQKVTDLIVKTYGIEQEFNDSVCLGSLYIYPPKYFYSLPFNDLQFVHSYADYLVDESHGVHLWCGSWNSFNERFLLRRKEYFKAIRKIYQTVFVEKKISYLYIKKVLIAFRDSLQIKNAFK